MSGRTAKRAETLSEDLIVLDCQYPEISLDMSEKEQGGIIASKWAIAFSYSGILDQPE